MSKKPFTRRGSDDTERLRGWIQTAFLLLNLWIGARFYLFVRYCETGGASLVVPRPAGVEGWLPIAGLMNVKYAIATHRFPEVHAAGFALFVAFGAMSLLFRKAFCSWLCPIGTISEWLWAGGRELFRRNVALPRRADVGLRALKYVLLGLFAFAVLSMSAEEIGGFLESPYGLIADVKMLNFFRTLGTTAAVVIVLLVVGSVFVKNPWCRYLCPYGALLGLASLLSPARIRRDPVSCIDCGKCTTACPSLIPVASLLTVKTAECTGCVTCITACPVAGALEVGIVGTRRSLPTWAIAAGVVALFLGVVGAAKIAGHWNGGVPTEVYMDLIPTADAFGHPGR